MIKFPESYGQARDRLLEAAKRFGGRHTSLPLSTLGPDNEPLAIEIISVGAMAAKRVLLHVAGTHGVEGFLGAAIQQACLTALPDLPADCAVIFVACLNPWGMSHLRRVTSSNIDLNRNFIADPLGYSGVPAGYRLIQDWLNPTRPPCRFELFYYRALYYIARHGFTALKQAIGAGQYEIERGLYFGGKSACQEATIFSGWLEKKVAPVATVWGIEVHSGLGPAGYDTLFVTKSASGRWAVPGSLESFLAHPISVEDPSRGVGFLTRGDLAKHVVSSRSSQDETVWILQEFGTKNPLQVLKAMRHENMHHHFGSGSLSHWSKRGLLEVFCPADPRWRQTVIERGRMLFQRAIQGFSGTIT